MDFSLFPRDVYADLDRLQRQMQQAFEFSPSIRGFARGGFPALNVGGTPQSVEIYAYVPGVDPSSIEVNLERGVLTLSGERKSALEGLGAKDTVHIEERFAGKFRRVVTLSDDLDPDSVEARCKDGLLHISVKRKAAAQPRRVTIQ